MSPVNVTRKYRALCSSLANLEFRQKEKQTFKFFLIISTLTKQTNLFSFFQEGSDSEKAIISDWLFLRMNEQSFSLKSFMLQP